LGGNVSDVLENLYAFEVIGPSKPLISSDTASGNDETICFGTMIGWDKGDNYALNPNGTEKWRYTTDHYITSDPAIGYDNTIYIGSFDGYLYTLYPNCTIRWKCKIG
jgi:outer membrane protein assembly factor BamB